MNVWMEYGSAVFLLLLLCVGLQLRREKPDTHLVSAQDSSAAKGLLCILVFYNHFSGYFSSIGPVFYVLNHIGHMLVAAFFFLSAYGIEKKYAGQKLAAGFLLKRGGKVLIPYWICLVVSVLSNWWFSVLNKEAVTVRNILLSIVSLREIVENCWFVTAILFLYLLYFISSQVLRKINIAVKMSVAMLLFSVLIYAQWAPTFFAFPLGCLVAQFEEKILTFMRRRGIVALVLTGCVTVCSALLKIYGLHTDSDLLQNISDALTVILFPIFIYVAAWSFRFGNAASRFLGGISYEVYLIHGLSIHIAVMIPGTNSNAPYLCICALGVTLMLAWVIHWIGGRLIWLLPWENGRRNKERV